MIDSGRTTVDRVLQGTQQTVSVTYYEDGAIADPGTVTVGIARADGTSLVSPGTATSGTGAAARAYLLSSANTALLDALTLTWTSATKGALTTHVEIVGGFLFSLNELDSAMRASHTTPDKIDARTLAETALEEACGRAFVPRYRRDRVSAGAVDRNASVTRIPLPWRVRAIRDVTVDGNALNSADLAALVIDGRYIYWSSGWSLGVRNIVVGYEYGMDAPPPRVARAARLLAKRWLVDGPIDERATSQVTELGTFTLSTPGIGGVTFGLPEVDAVVNRYQSVTLVG